MNVFRQTDWQTSALLIKTRKYQWIIICGNATEAKDGELILKTTVDERL